MRLALLVVLAGSCAVSNAGLSAMVRPIQEDSCVGKCEQGLIPGASCQCNAACSSHNDCCSDYSSVCLSCKDRCGIDYFPNNECQCNSECPNFGNCCSDYDQECAGFTGTPPPSGEVTDAMLKEFSEKLATLDANNAASLLSIDIQGSTSQGSSTDNAPNPLFTTFDAAIWDIPTIALFRALFDNYVNSVTTEEDHTADEQAEEDAFLDAVMDTAVMNEMYDFVANRTNIFSGSKDDLRAKIYELWFQPYDRDGTSATVLGSSGFEHVFLGELKDGKVSGFHNWLHFAFEEQAGNINYKGWLDTADFAAQGSGLSMVFTWNSQPKSIGSMFVGTSPELDLAVFTTCFLARESKDCPMSYNGGGFYITTFNLIQDGTVHVGTAYPDWA